MGPHFSIIAMSSFLHPIAFGPLGSQVRQRQWAARRKIVKKYTDAGLSVGRLSAASSVRCSLSA